MMLFPIPYSMYSRHDVNIYIYVCMLVCVHNMPAIDYLQSILWDHSTHSMLGVSACFIPSATGKQVKKKKQLVNSSNA